MGLDETQILWVKVLCFSKNKFKDFLIKNKIGVSFFPTFHTAPFSPILKKCRECKKRLKLKVLKHRKEKKSGRFACIVSSKQPSEAHPKSLLPTY
jgi:hypothetical protein